jgi:hypothetical protein
MFVVVTVLAVVIAYHVNWIRQRRAVLAQHYQANWQRSNKAFGIWPTGWDREASPGMLWLFGEPAQEFVWVFVEDRNNIAEQDDAELSRVKRLFPESNVECGQWLPADQF